MADKPFVLADIVTILADKWLNLADIRAISADKRKIKEVTPK